MSIDSRIDEQFATSLQNIDAMLVSESTIDSVWLVYIHDATLFIKLQDLNEHNKFTNIVFAVAVSHLDNNELNCSFDLQTYIKAIKLFGIVECLKKCIAGLNAIVDDEICVRSLDYLTIDKTTYHTYQKWSTALKDAGFVKSSCNNVYKLENKNINAFILDYSTCIFALSNSCKAVSMQLHKANAYAKHAMYWFDIVYKYLVQ